MSEKNCHCISKQHATDSKKSYGYQQPFYIHKILMGTSPYTISNGVNLKSFWIDASLKMQRINGDREKERETKRNKLYKLRMMGLWATSQLGSLHSLKPSVTSQPIQNILNFTSVTSQSIICLWVCVAPGVLIYVVNLISFIDIDIIQNCDVVWNW